MKGSLNLGKYSEIKVAVHWTFLILPVYIVIMGYSRDLSTEQIIWNIVLVLAVFVCVTFHEFGHALMAKRFNFKTKDITLLPIGGVARMESMPENPRQEFLVAIAGPMVNFIISAILLLFIDTNELLPEDASAYMPSGKNFLFLLMVVNFFIGTFNLIPAFPMDGGRVLRALLAIKMSRAAATRIASSIGQMIAIGFILIGLFYNLFLTLIGIFILIGARSEWFVEHSKFILSDHTVGDILMNEYHVLNPNQSLQEAVDVILNSSAKNFIIVENERVVGTFLKSTLIKALSKMDSKVQVSEVMNKNIRFLNIDTPLTDVYNIQKGPLFSEVVMPVVKNGSLIGVLDMENIVEFIEVQEAVKSKNNISY